MAHTILGTDRETDTQVTIDTELRQRSMYVVGIQGGGKSSFLQTLIHQDIVSGSCVIVIDPHEDLLYDVIAQLPEEYLAKTFLLDLSDRAFPFGLNIFACANHKDDEQRDITRNRVAHMFERIWPETVGGRYFGTLLENVIDTLIENPGATMADIPALLQDDTRRSQFVSHLQNREVKNYWTQDYNTKSASVRQKERDPLVSRVRELLRQTTIKNIICQKNATFDFRTAIENKEIILINLPLRSPAYEKSAPIMGIMLLSEICRAVFSFADIRDITKRPRFSLYVDEYQNFTTSDFSRLFTEGRKFGIRTTVAHQERSQLDDTNRNASHTAFTKVAFQTTNKDASELADYFRTKDTWVRPKNVYSDVLTHLKDHPNPDVATFYETYIKPLQNVAKEKIKRYRDEVVYPELTVGGKTVSVDPEIVTQQLEGFRKCLYAVSCGEEFEWPNYATIARWWDFYLVYNKFGWSQPPLEEGEFGWIIDCQETPFNEDAYVVSLLRQYGGVARWKPLTNRPGRYQAIIDEQLETQWSEKKELALPLARMRENEATFYTVVFNRYTSNTRPTFLETYHAGTLTHASLQTLARSNGFPPTKDQIEHMIEQRRSKSMHNSFPLYIRSLQSHYKARIGHMIPQRPSYPNRTCRFLWWTYQRELTLAEWHTWTEYNEEIVRVYTVTSSHRDCPARITAPFSVWKDALDDEAKLLELFLFATEPSYFLHGIGDPDLQEKRFTQYYEGKDASPNDYFVGIQEDIQKTYTEVAKDITLLKEHVHDKILQIRDRVTTRMTMEEERLTQFRTLFLATVDELQKRPLGELKTPSNTEVKESILSLKPRQAYVRIGTAVHTIHTLTVPDKVAKNELTRRVASIREQTHQTYCQKLSVVEAAGVAENTEEEGTQPRLKEEQETAPTTRVFQAFEELDEE